MVYHIAGGKQTHSQQFSHFFKALDGDPDRVELEDNTQDDGAPVVMKWTAGRAMKPDHMPTRLMRGGPGPKQSPVLDVEAFYDGTLLVRQTFKDIVEMLEPGAHRFFPMAVYVKSRDPTTWQPEDGHYLEPKGKKTQLMKLADYWLFNICNRLDSYHPSTIGRTERGFFNPRKIGVEGHEVFSLDRIGRRHAWYDKFAPGRYLSDTLADRLKNAGLTGMYLKHYDQL